MTRLGNNTRPRHEQEEEEKDVRLVCLLAFLLPQDALWILSSIVPARARAKILMKLSSIKTWLFHDRDPGETQSQSDNA